MTQTVTKTHCRNLPAHTATHIYVSRVHHTHTYIHIHIYISRVYPLVHPAAAAEVNDLDGAAAGVAQQNIFGFHVAVHLEGGGGRGGVWARGGGWGSGVQLA